MSKSHSNYQLHLIQDKLTLATFERTLQRLVADGDELLFLNDSVFVLLLADFSSEKFCELTSKVSVNAIDEHLQARNIADITDKLNVISFTDFIEKSQNCCKIVSW